MSIVALLLLGAIAWTASEYGMHRFAGHGRMERRSGRFWWVTPSLLFIVFREEHVAHHRDPLYFAPTWKKTLAAVILVPVLGGLASLAVGAAGGLAFGVGFAATYFGYEVLHRRIHTHAPANAYFAWMRRHHLHHHVAPKVNFGVTTAVWDRAARTIVTPHPVKLPRSLAPVWLRDPVSDGLRAEFSGDYELVGR